MLLCCSQRTDLCAFYSDWLVNRFQAGLVDIRNPFAPRQVLRVDCSPGQVDAVIFMTKNPTPMLDKMAVFRDYAVGFQVTVTPFLLFARLDSLGFANWMAKLRRTVP